MKKLLLFTVALFLMGGLMAQFTVTFNVDLNDVEGFNADTTEVFMAGDFLGWNTPGSNPDYKMTATTEDPLIYTLDFEFPGGDTTLQYKYFFVYNGQESWDFGEWTGTDNRIISVRETIALSDVWGDRPSVVTLNVDMTDAEAFDPATDEIFLAGTVNIPHGWVTPGEMMNMKLQPVEAGSMMYTTNLSLYNGDYEYKYFKVINGEASWDGGEWEGGDNRALSVDTTATVDNKWGDPTFGINDINAGPIVSLFPNPCQSEITVSFFENTNDINKVEVYNVTGALVQTIDSFTSQMVTISTANLTSGVYFVAVHNQQGIQTAKFIKE